jgi:hypothetical protein
MTEREVVLPNPQKTDEVGALPAGLIFVRENLKIACCRVRAVAPAAGRWRRLRPVPPERRRRINRGRTPILIPGARCGVCDRRQSGRYSGCQHKHLESPHACLQRPAANPGRNLRLARPGLAALTRAINRDLPTWLVFVREDLEVARPRIRTVATAGFIWRRCLRSICPVRVSAVIAGAWCGIRQGRNSGYENECQQNWLEDRHVTLQRHATWPP